MSIARDRITEVLSTHVGCRLSEEHVKRLAHDLMPAVRDAVARAFEEAARQFECHPDLSGAAGYLNRWAVDARKDNR